MRQRPQFMVFVLALSLFLLFQVPVLAGGGSLTVSVNPQQATLEDEITLTVTATGNHLSGEPVLPSISGFKIVSSGKSTSIQIINGSVSSNYQYSYILIPQAEGEYVIDPITMKDGDDVLKTDPITIKIGRNPSRGPTYQPLPDPRAQQQQGGSPLQDAPDVDNKESSAVPSGSDVWITADISKKNPYINEQILLTFKFYTRVNVGQASLTPPEFKDFVAEEVVPEKKYYQEIKGSRYVVSEKVWALFPIRSGTLTLAGTTLDVEVPDASQNPFGSMFKDPFFAMPGLRTKTKHLHADPIALSVKELPQPIPNDFNSLVGQFHVSTHLDPNEVKVGDSATWVVEWGGSGNIRDALGPVLPDIKGIKVYPDKPDADLIKSAEGVKGKKTFKYAFVPTEVNRFNLPAMTASTFNPLTGEYEHFTLEGGSLNALANPNAWTPPVASVPAPSDSPVAKETKPVAKDQAIEPSRVKTYQDQLEKFYQKLVRHQSTIIKVIGGFLILLCCYFVGGILKKKLDTWRAPQKKKKQAYAQLVKQIKKAHTKDLLLSALRDFFGSVFSQQGSAFTGSDMMAQIKKLHLSSANQLAWQELIYWLEASLYQKDGGNTLEGVALAKEKIKELCWAVVIAK